MKNKKKWIVRGIMTWIIIDKVILFNEWRKQAEELEKVQKHNTDLFNLNIALIKRMHPSERQKFLTDLSFVNITKDL